MINVNQLLDLFRRHKGVGITKAHDRPFWHGRATISRARSRPFQSSRRHGGNPLGHMQIEEFADKEKRDFRFRELRYRKNAHGDVVGTPHLSKFSTVRDNKNVWCIVRP